MSSFAKLILATLLVGVTVNSVEAKEFLLPIPIYGTPPAHVDHWMRIIWQGRILHPIVPVYFITERRIAPKYSVTRYVILTPQEYEALAEFTYAYQCSQEHIGSEPPYSNTIEIDESTSARVRDVCVFSRDDGCQYLFGLAGLPGIDWSHKDTWPLFQFEAELGCAKPLTLAHDAGGHFQ